jgi:hypothetical protein
MKVAKTPQENLAKVSRELGKPQKQVPSSPPQPIQNVTNKQFQVPAKALPNIKGMGRHQQQQQAQPSDFANPINQHMSDKPLPGNNMAQQAKGIGNVIDSKSDMSQHKNPLLGALPGLDKMSGVGEIGRENYEAQDNPLTNPLHPQSLGPLAAQKYGECHNAARKKALEIGGKVYTTSGRNQGMHSICVYPDNTVYDFVLGIDKMPLSEYLANVPFSFAPNA